ncbi:MAG: hypothetical protein LC808_25900 [Actinobacteria bacterium]|nr:hypothetical protein [Actinomycetota bacterium]
MSSGAVQLVELGGGEARRLATSYASWEPPLRARVVETVGDHGEHGVGQRVRQPLLHATSSKCAPRPRATHTLRTAATAPSDRADSAVASSREVNGRSAWARRAGMMRSSCPDSRSDAGARAPAIRSWKVSLM